MKMADKIQSFLYGVVLTGAAAFLGWTFWAKPIIKDTADELRSCAGTLEQTAGELRGCANDLTGCADMIRGVQKELSYGWVNEGSMFASLQRNVEGMGLVTYSIALDAAMIGTGEAVRIDGLDGVSVSYADNLPHDGLVDLITMIDKEGNPTSFFLRAESYDAHQQLFDNADQGLKEIKAIFAEKQ